MLRWLVHSYFCKSCKKYGYKIYKLIQFANNNSYQNICFYCDNTPIKTLVVSLNNTNGFQENCPRGKFPLALIPTLILNQTLTLTGGQFFSGTIFRTPYKCTYVPYCNLTTCIIKVILPYQFLNISDLKETIIQIREDV